MSSKRSTRSPSKRKQPAEPPSASCDGVVADLEGGLYSVVVYTNGEAFNSFVYHASDVASRSAPNVQTQLLDVSVQLTALWRSPAGRLYVGDAEGRVHQFDGNVWSVTQVSTRPLTVIWGRGEGEVYSAGDEGVVYRADGTAWTPLGASLGETIFAVRGATDGDLYVCGANGLFARHDGRTWTPIQLPLKGHLRGLAVRTADEVFVCGAEGVLFRGAGATWADLSQPAYDLHAIESFRGTLFVAAGGEGLFTFDGKTLTNVKAWPCYRLAANTEYLGAAGAALAARFDGAAWFGARYS
jgi:hypothetical protein